MNNEELRLSLKNGDFFKHSLHRYIEEKLSICREIVIVGIILTFLFIILVVLCSGLFNVFPIVKEIPITLYHDSLEGDVYAIKDLDYSMRFDYGLDINDSELSPYNAVARYLSAQYVTIFEGYNNYNIDNNKENNLYIENNSSYAVYQNYLEKQKNFSQYDGILKTKINKIFIFSDEKSSGKANINLSVYDIQNPKNMTNYSINLNFILSNLNLSLKSIIPFEFIVVNYRSAKA
ncbi:MAG: hypothetical protein OEY79_00410 [Anaplasmataceae bacterium]|nr:hypothetical protein [Anaplasmataceae bacterium]